MQGSRSIVKRKYSNLKEKKNDTVLLQLSNNDLLSFTCLWGNKRTGTAFELQETPQQWKDFISQDSGVLSTMIWEVGKKVRLGEPKHSR